MILYHATPRSSRRRRRLVLGLERLESRTVPASLVPGLSPAQVRQAYGFDHISFPTTNGSVVGDGRGQTIAIVDAYDDPTIAADLHTFDKQFGLPDPVLVKATPTGQTKPQADAGWSSEIALDVEWAHAMAPAARILLVEAHSASLTNLLGAASWAATQPGVHAVSMSWGSAEFAGETALDHDFQVPGVSFVAAAGDAGQPALWPALSPNVLGVGGTSLYLDASGNRIGETAWGNDWLSWALGGGGGGPSRYEPRPAFQSGVLPPYYGRGGPDVAYNADPANGYAIYDSMNGGWYTAGGTSAGAPQWAALIAITDQGRALHGSAPLGSTQTLNAVYQLPGSDFHDITQGSNGYAAQAGYDFATGRGSPIANRVVGDLVTFGTTAASQLHFTTATAVLAQPLRTHAAVIIVLAPTLSVPLFPTATPLIQPVTPIRTPNVLINVTPPVAPTGLTAIEAAGFLPSELTAERPGLPVNRAAAERNAPRRGLRPPPPLPVMPPPQFELPVNVPEEEEQPAAEFGPNSDDRERRPAGFKPALGALILLGWAGAFCLDRREPNDDRGAKRRRA